MRSRIAVALAVAVITSAIAYARQDVPVFRSGITVVQIDAFVTDAQGQPVTGLAADDFEVFEAGTSRPIASFAAINTAIGTPAGLPREDGVEPDVADNRRPAGRTYLFALDEVHPERALRARHILREFVSAQLGPDDIASVALTGRGLADSGQDFTTNRRLLLNAFERFTGGFPDGGGDTRCGHGSDKRQLASSLRALTEFLATLPGRKVLVYVGEALGGLDFYELEAYRGGALDPAGNDAHAALAAATRGNVTIYPLDPCGLTAGSGPAELERRIDLQAIAALTGGFAITNTNNYRDALSRVVSENSTYYTIGFESGRIRTDGRFVRVDVRVKRPGLRVNARPGYLAPNGAPAPRRGRTADARFAAVGEALGGATQSALVPMRVVATPYRVERKEARVALAVELDVAGLALTGKNGNLTTPLEVSYLATDARGRLSPGRRYTTTLTIPDDAPARMTLVRVLSDFRLRPGRHQLRIAAGTETVAGSVLYNLEVPDFTAQPLAMSGLFLSSDETATIPTMGLEYPLSGVLPGPTTASREFRTTDTLAIFAEVYANTARNAPATPVTVTVSLRHQDGQTTLLATQPDASVSASAPRRVAVKSPLAGVRPGPYVVEVAANSPAHREMSVTRKVPITVR